jgi:hypothetical protein
MKQAISNIITKLLGLVCVKKNRKFYHVDGFGDDTLYINHKNGVTHCVSKDGEWTKDRWMNKERLEFFVAEGFYVERP